MEGWWVASKGLAALPRTRGSTQAHGCSREGSGALPLARAAAMSTGLRVRHHGGEEPAVQLDRLLREPRQPALGEEALA